VPLPTIIFHRSIKKSAYLCVVIDVFARTVIDRGHEDDVTQKQIRLVHSYQPNHVQFFYNLLILLVPQEGIEPPTHALRMRANPLTVLELHVSCRVIVAHLAVLLRGGL
jgi:hypothetical protein